MHGLRQPAIAESELVMMRRPPVRYGKSPAAASHRRGREPVVNHTAERVEPLAHLVVKSIK